MLRERFTGQAEHVVNFFEFIAQEVREYLAALLGFRSLDEAIGRAEPDRHPQGGGPLEGPWPGPLPRSCTCQRLTIRGAAVVEQDHGLEHALDNELIELSRPALENGELVRGQVQVRNVNRTVGTMLGAEVTRRLRGRWLA